MFNGIRDGYQRGNQQFKKVNCDHLVPKINLSCTTFSINVLVFCRFMYMLQILVLTNGYLHPLLSLSIDVVLRRENEKAVHNLYTGLNVLQVDRDITWVSTQRALNLQSSRRNTRTRIFSIFKALFIMEGKGLNVSYSAIMARQQLSFELVQMNNQRITHFCTEAHGNQRMSKL